MSYSDAFSHIEAYLGRCVTLAYSEPCYNQNPGIFRNYDISEIYQVIFYHIHNAV